MLGKIVFEYLGEIMLSMLLALYIVGLFVGEPEASLIGFNFSLMFGLAILFQKQAQKYRDSYTELWSRISAWATAAKEIGKEAVVHYDGKDTLKFRVIDDPKVLPSEALYGFASWLTIRNEAVTFSASHDAAKAAELVNEYCKAQGYEDPRDSHYPGNIVKMGNVAHGVSVTPEEREAQ